MIQMVETGFLPACAKEPRVLLSLPGLPRPGFHGVG